MFLKCLRGCLGLNKMRIGVDVGGQYFFDVEDYEVYSVQIQNTVIHRQISLISSEFYF